MQRTKFIGTNQTTPGAATAPSTLLTSAVTAEWGLKITLGSGATQPSFRIKDASGNTISEVLASGHWCFYNTKVGAVAQTSLKPACLNGTFTIPCIEFPDGTGGNIAMRIWSGTGAPPSSTGSTFSKLPTGVNRVGDWYIRRDGGAGTYIYRCTSAATVSVDVGAWTAIA